MRTLLFPSGRRWMLALAIGAAIAACGDNPLNPFYRIDVDIANPGSGAGNVVSVEPGLNISCALGPADSCSEGFNDAGAGGTFSLDATPSSGSTFVQWLGCSSTSGNRCTLTFSATAGDTTFNVTAYFVGEGPPGE